MTIEIRDARPEDEQDWRRLWAGYTAFYQVEIAADITDATWERIFDPASALFMRVAVLDGTMVGFALCLSHEATWVKQPVCYLEDLYLDAAARGRGIGRALLDDLVTLTKARGWARLYWHTHENNRTARKLYDQYGTSDAHVRYRLSV